jgi:hypothetical protein
MQNRFRNYKHYDYLILAGFVLTTFSSFGVLMILVKNDMIFGTFDILRIPSIILSCIVFAIGATTLFWGVRNTARGGTFSYRITHPLSRRRLR